MATLLPPPLVAVTVKVVSERRAEGVPEITQVVFEMESPVGSAGEMVQLVSPPPLFSEGVTVMADPQVPVVPVAPEKERVGATEEMVIVK